MTYDRLLAHDIGETYIISGHMKALGEYLTRTNTSQSAFAKRVGVSQPTIANLIGGIHGASVGVLKRISQETGMSIDELLADSAESESGHVA